MKSYKLVNSKEAQQKAERLGLSVFQPSSDVSLEKDCLMFVEEGVYYTRNKPFCYASNDFIEITQKDFLALPEPLKSLRMTKDMKMILESVSTGGSYIEDPKGLIKKSMDNREVEIIE